MGRRITAVVPVVFRLHGCPRLDKKDFTTRFFDNYDIFQAVEDCGVHIVCEDISNGLKYFEGKIDEETDPLDAVVDYYLKRSSCATMYDTKKRYERFRNLIEKYSIDSVLYFTLKFCDSNLIDYPYFNEKLQKQKIPVIFIEGEQGMSNIQNIKTRILLPFIWINGNSK